MLASAQAALQQGVDLSGYSWLTVAKGQVTKVDFPKYLRFVQRMKVTPAFDGVDLSNGENSLFGTATVNARHFTTFSKEHSTVKGELAEPELVKLMNPMQYIGTTGSKTAEYWRIRHGAMDSDTALPIPAILAAWLSNKGYQVDFAVPWGQGHGGDYDLPALFAWMDKVGTGHAAQGK